jgi:hypothetical protein
MAWKASGTVAGQPSEIQLGDTGAVLSTSVGFMDYLVDELIGGVYVDATTTGPTQRVHLDGDWALALYLSQTLGMTLTGDVPTPPATPDPPKGAERIY